MPARPGPGFCPHPPSKTDVLAPTRRERARLADRESKIIAELYEQFHNIVKLAVQPVDSSAMPGQAAYNSLSMLNMQRNMVSVRPGPVAGPCAS